MFSKNIFSSCAWIVCLVAIGCGKGSDSPQKPTQPEQTVETEPQVDPIAAAKKALENEDLDAAESALQRGLLVDPENVRALELLGETALRRRKPDVSLSHFRSAIEFSDTPSKALLSRAAEVAMVSGRPFESIQLLVQLNQAYPKDFEGKFDLIGLSAMMGVTHEGLPHLHWLAQRGQTDFESLQAMADPLRIEPDGELCERSLKRCPDDLRAHFGLAKLEAIKLDWEAVLLRLKPVVEKHRDFVPALSLYGRALFEAGKYDEIPAWHDSLPKNIEESSGYWVVAGLWAEHSQKPAEAAYAFGRALKADETVDPRALQGLASSLRALERTDEADKVSRHLAAFAKMRDALKTHLDRENQSQQAAASVAEAMVDLGRIWEAEAWMRLAVPLPDDRIADLRERYAAIRSKLTVKTPWQLPEHHLATAIDLSDLPSVQWSASEDSTNRFVGSEAGKIQFEDQASARGWIHTCDLAPRKPGDGHWIYQSVGGGVSVVDYDLDGWPDLVAARLDGVPMKANSSPNRLFRNDQGNFRDVSLDSHYQDAGFSQGIAVGDFNSDGFPDLYDANFGRNRLFRNNGDGTFSDVTDEVGLSEVEWTTSTVIADINGDAIADIFETAYCEREPSVSHACYGKNGKIMTCSPLKLPAKGDSFFLGRENGQFAIENHDWLNESTLGRGLGIVVGQLNERRGLDIYVANDMTANHLWSINDASEKFAMVDLSVLSGVGASGHSLSQASMGIAAGDPDHDGDIDLFLTHFMDDHNTYYEQVRPGVWVDRSYQAGLSQPSVKLLGFGTEWIDFDNNGVMELIVANGHVDDFKNPEIPYRMPAQLFSLGADGRWSEMKRDSLGDYFQKTHVGRAVASVDINRDGLMDVAITHLEAPVSLLVNQTEKAGESIGLVLKSTTTHRDAIGAIVSATIDGQRSTYQLLAGDGYMCSNQRQITIGLGNATKIEDLTVSWMSGTVEKIGELQPGRNYLIVEGENAAFELSQHQSSN